MMALRPWRLSPATVVTVMKIRRALCTMPQDSLHHILAAI